MKHSCTMMNLGDTLGMASSRRTPVPYDPLSPADHETEGRSTAPRVLVVDDTEDTRLLYALTFAEAGYEVLEATNGQEALELIAEAKPDVVLMDLSMPLMDGWEATKRIKGHPATANVVVIALTGHGTHFGHRSALEAGADLLLVKPCLPETVLAHVRSLLGDA